MARTKNPRLRRKAQIRAKWLRRSKRESIPDPVPVVRKAKAKPAPEPEPVLVVTPEPVPVVTPEPVPVVTPEPVVEAATAEALKTETPA